MKNGNSLGSNKAMVFRILGFPGGSAGKESTCNAGAGFNPWVRKIPWRRERLPHSSIPAWRIPWTIQSVELQRVGHD